MVRLGNEVCASRNSD